MKKIAILGSTGSIGTQTVDILPSIDAEVVALTTNRRINLLEEQARALHPKMVCAMDENAAKALKIKLADTDIEVLTGMDGLIACAAESGADIVVTAVVGMVGLLPTMAAIQAGKDIALANKETLVCAGGLVMSAAKQYGVRILPVDSEHSAIFQCVQAANGNPIDKILLTASGGPFFGKKAGELQHIRPADALKHPNWDMGAKVTIDSSTLMKGAGHFKGTSIWDGNCAIAGHNRGVRDDFGDLHTLERGDTITWTTKLGVRTYEVTSVQKVKETDTSGTAPSNENKLTLYTCVRNQRTYRWQVQAAEVV